MNANLTLLETDAADGEAMNIGSTGNISIEELAEHIIDETGADVSQFVDWYRNNREWYEPLVLNF